ncbi:MAG: hypothetical protein V1647_05705, partial [Pseudomonadota bacterium]
MKDFYGKIISLVLVLSLIGAPGGFAEEEESATEKAGKQLVEKFTALIGDVKEMSRMSDKEKVQYVLTKGAERIKEQSISSAKDAVKEKIVEYAQARLRADLFKQEAQSMIHKAVMEGKNVGELWSQADINIKSKIDTNINALKAGLATLEIGWEVFSVWSTKGTEAGLKTLGEKVGEKIIEYFIPGWGYYKLAQDLVKAIGEYVVNYAFDTALDAKVKAVLGANNPAKNPSGFAEWIMN